MQPRYKTWPIAEAPKAESFDDRILVWNKSRMEGPREAWKKDGKWVTWAGPLYGESPLGCEPTHYCIED